MIARWRRVTISCITISLDLMMIFRSLEDNLPQQATKKTWTLLLHPRRDLRCTSLPQENPLRNITAHSTILLRASILRRISLRSLPSRKLKLHSKTASKLHQEWTLRRCCPRSSTTTIRSYQRMLIMSFLRPILLRISPSLTKLTRREDGSKLRLRIVTSPRSQLVRLSSLPISMAPPVPRSTLV